MSITDEKATIDHIDHVEVKRTASEEAGSDPNYISPADNKRVLRKIDLNLMPVFSVIVAFQFLDKTALTYTSVMGIMYDCKMDSDQYAWLGSIFSLGFLIGQYPMCFLQQRFAAALGKFTALNIIIWGLIVALTSLCHTWSQLMACRFFLGVFESSITPALMLFTAQWYRKSEQGARTGIWASFTTWGGILGAGVAYKLFMAGNTKGGLTMASWRCLFIFLGCCTIFIGIVFGFVVPDTVRTAWFLNEEEKEIAERRTLENMETIGEKKFQMYQVKEAFKDPQVILMTAVGILNSIANGGITNFYAILVLGIGIKIQDGILLSMLNCWVAVVTIIALVYGAKIKKRALVSAAPHLISMTGAILVWQLPQKATKARLAGFYLTLVYAIAMTACMGLISSNVTGRTKKTTVSAIFFVFQQVGNLIGPQTFRKKYAPRYAPALIIVVICNILTIILMVALHMYYVRENKRRDRLAQENPAEATPHLDLTPEEHIDLTDRENLHFRYAT